MLGVLLSAHAWGQEPKAKAEAEPKAVTPQVGPAPIAPTHAAPAHGAPAHGEAAGGGHGGDGHGGVGHAGEIDMNPAEFRSDLAIYSFIVFGLLLLILYKFAWDPIMAGLEKREHGIAANIAAAERMQAEGRALLAEYERKLAASADEVRKIIEEARRDGEQTVQDLVKQGQAEAQLYHDRAKRELDTAKAQALKELAETSANLAIELGGKLIRAQLRPEDHVRLIEESLAKFPSKN